MRCTNGILGSRPTIILHPQPRRAPVKLPVTNLTPPLPHLLLLMARTCLQVRATTLRRLTHQAVTISVLRNRPINLLPPLLKSSVIITLLLRANLRPHIRLEVDTIITMTRHNNSHTHNGRSIIPRPALRILAKFQDLRDPRRPALPPPRPQLINAPLQSIPTAHPLLRHSLHTITHQRRQPTRRGVMIQHVITRRPGPLPAEMTKVCVPT